MHQEDQQFLTDQPLKFLSMLPPRRLNNVSFSLQKLQKFYESLKCPICLEILSNPVYLKCSHRFCKSCIEKVIRTNEKKSCPNCRGELSTRRDLRQDFILTTIITYAFGDTQKLRTKVDNAEKNCKNSQNGFNTLPPEIISKNKSLKHLGPGKKPTPDSQSETKRQRSQSHLQQIAKESVSQQRKQPNTGQKLEKQTVNLQIKIQLAKNQSSMSQTKKTKKQKNEVIEISSSEEPQCVQIVQKSGLNTIQEEKPSADGKGNSVEESQVDKKNDKDKYISEESLENSRPTRRQKKKPPQQATNGQRQTIFLRSKRHLDQNINSSKDQKTKKEIVPFKKAEEVTQKSKQQIEPQLPLEKQLQQAKQLLKESYGEQYLQKIIYACKTKYVVGIQLKKLPKSILTPVLKEKYLYISITAQVSDISRMIGSKLNIENHTIIKIHIKKVPQKLHTIKKDNSKEVFDELEDPKKTLLDINEAYWKKYNGVEEFSIANMQNFLNQQLYTKDHKPWRALYFSIQTDKLISKK